MDKDLIIQQMETALRDTDKLYNRLGDGEVTFSEVGHLFHSFLGDEIITALQKALVYMKTEEE